MFLSIATIQGKTFRALAYQVDRYRSVVIVCTIPPITAKPFVDIASMNLVGGRSRNPHEWLFSVFLSSSVDRGSPRSGF